MQRNAAGAIFSIVLMVVALGQALSASGQIDKPDVKTENDREREGVAFAQQAATLLKSWRASTASRNEATRLEAQRHVARLEQMMQVSLLMAATMGREAEISALLDAGTPIEGDDRMPPLVAAVSVGRFETARLLLARGANANAKGQDGDTALMSALPQDNARDLIALLLLYGADVNLAGNGGETPLARVESIVDNRALVDQLRKAGAKAPAELLQDASAVAASVTASRRSTPTLNGEPVALREIPNLLARDTIRRGDWKEMEVRTDVAAVQVVPAIGVRVEVAGVTAMEITTLVGQGGSAPRREVVSREPFYSRDALARALKPIGELTSYTITDVTIEPAETIAIGTSSLRCDKVVMAFDASVSPDGGLPFSMAAVMTYWYTESIPLDGVAKSVVRVQATGGGASLGATVTQTTTRYGRRAQ